MPDELICCNLEMNYMDTRDDGDVYGCINCESVVLVGDIGEQYDISEYKKNIINLEIHSLQEEDYGESVSTFTFTTENKQVLNYPKGYCSIEEQTFEIYSITLNEENNTYSIAFKTNHLQTKHKSLEVTLFNM